MRETKRFMQQESRFSGHYAATVFETLRFAYRGFTVRIAFCLLLGLLGRGLLLANANLIGFWVDSLSCGISDAPCTPPPAWFAGFTPLDFLVTLLIFCGAGFAFTLIFRIGFSRLSAQAVSLIYDETTLRTSRFPMSFFDASPAGRIITRFSTDYGHVFRLFGGPLAEFLSIICDLVWMVVLISVASLFYTPLVAVIALMSYGIYRLNRARLRVERRDLSANRSPSIAHFAETAQGAGTIRSFLRQASFSGRFSRLNDLFLNQKLRSTRLLLGFSM